MDGYLDVGNNNSSKDMGSEVRKVIGHFKTHPFGFMGFVFLIVAIILIMVGD